MSIKLDKRYTLSEKNTVDVVDKKHLYKSKKGWMTSSKKFVVGASALGAFMAVNVGLASQTASADTSFPDVDTSDVTKTTGESENGDGYKVDVDHSQLDQAVNDAQNTGVNVSKGDDTYQKVTEDQKAQAVDNIAKDYSQQVQSVREATEAQRWKNDTYQNDMDDANKVNNENKNKIDQAVKEAQDAGVKVGKTDDVTITAKPGRYDNSDYENKKQEVINNTQAQVNALKQATAIANANNTVNASNDHSALDQAVKDAQAAGVIVNKTDDVNRKQVTVENASQISQVIRDDYAAQVDAISKVIAEQNAKQAEYEKQKEEYRTELKKQGIDIDNLLNIPWENSSQTNVEILQRPVIYEENNQYLGNIVPAGDAGTINMYYNGSVNGDFLKVAFTNLQNSTYDNHKLSKIEIVYSDLIAEDPKNYMNDARYNGLSNGQWPDDHKGYTTISIYKNQFLGTWLGNAKSVTLTMNIYDENGNKIDPQGGYLFVGSLNNYSWGNYTEQQQFLSPGEIIIPKDSAIVDHGNGLLYADRKIDGENEQWENNQQILGTALFKIGSSDIKWKYIVDNRTNGKVGSGSWFYTRTSLNSLPSPIKPDQIQTSYHYNTFTPASGGDQANYHYENLAVEKPDQESANYHYNGLEIQETADKGATGVVNNQDQDFTGKMIVAGDHFVFDIKPASLQGSTGSSQAMREEVESFTFQDKIPDGFAFEDLTVSDGQSAQDLTHEFNISFNKETNTVTATAKKGMIDAINHDRTQTYALPVFHVHVKATKSGIATTNVANIWLDGVHTKTNEVPNKTTISKPSKDVTIDGDKADGANTVASHVQEWKVTVDLKDFDPQTTQVTDSSVANGLSVQDTMTGKNGATFLVDTNSFVLHDQNGNAIPSDLYTLETKQVSDSEFTFNLAVKDPRAFLNSYGGQELYITYKSTIKDNVNGSIENKAVQNNFGVTYDTNTTHTDIVKLDPHKDVVVSADDNTSLNRHIVAIGQTMAYSLDSAKRPANYAGNTTQWSKSDTLDKKDTYNNTWKVTTLTSFTVGDKTYNAGDDISSMFDVAFDAGTNTITATAKQEYIDAINQASNKQGEQQWRIYVGVTRNAAGHITNVFNEKYNGLELTSNEVYTNTLNNPTKEWDNESGENSNDKGFLAGDHAIGNVSADIPTSDMFNDSYTFDKYQVDDIFTSFKDKVDVGASKVFVDKEDITDLFDIKLDTENGIVSAITKDPSKLLQYGGKKLNFMTDFQIKNDVPAGTQLQNDGRQYVNDVEMKLDKKPTITTFTQTPVKDVQIDKLNGQQSSVSQSIDGQKVVNGTVVTFPLSTKDPLPANRGTVINKEERIDTLQDGLEYQGFTAYVKDKDGNIIDATDWYDAKQDGQTITFVGNQKLFDYYNKDKSVATERPIILLYAKTTKEATEYKNNYKIVTNNNDVVSNEVKVTTPKIDPVKFVTNTKDEDINDKTIARGDQLNYKITFDLSDLDDLNVTDEQAAIGLSVYDDYDETMLKVDKNNAIYVTDANGKTVSSGLYSVTWDDANGKWTLRANDSKAFLNLYKGQKLTIHFMAKAAKNVDGDIKNQAFQNTFGQINGTNIVINHLKKMDPKKDVTVNVGSQESLDDKTININDIFNYKLVSSVRPANYGGITENWDFTDKLDSKDQFTGQWQVRTDYDITLPDGTVLKKGTDVSKWFYQEFDAETNTVKVKASKEFLDILNSDINRKTEQGFTAYIQAKRIGYGDVKNIFTENYNGEDVQSNEVVTHTPEPEKPTPETPQKGGSTPSAPETPQPTPVSQTGSATPAQPAQLPQTGDSEEGDLLAIIGLAFAGLGLGLGGVYRRKRTN